MTKPFVVLDATERDLASAADGYDAQARGLGDDFLHEVDQALDRIGSFPDMYPFAFADVRRAIVRRFPFAVAYRIRTAAIDIIGVLPCRADPQMLAKRATYQAMADDEQRNRQADEWAEATIPDIDDEV